jgi:hypothetical protein
MPQLFWNPETNPTPFNNYTEEVGPFQPQDVDAGEFSFQDYIPTSISKSLANATRIIASTSSSVDEQAKTPAWYDVFGRVSAAASSVNDAFQSTLVKVIVILVLAGIGFIYFQAKVVNLANK